MANISVETLISVIVFALCLIAFALLAGVFRRAARLFRRKKRLVILDGSNVMHWREGKPEIQTVIAVVRYLEKRGYMPGVVFDANAGYLLMGKYQHDRALAQLLRLPEARVMVVPKGTPADPAILKAARDYGAPVVTNDRFKDWAKDFPEVKTDGHLITGRIEPKRVVLDLP